MECVVQIVFNFLAQRNIITHAGIAAGVGRAFSRICLFVCLSVCLSAL